MPSPKAPPIIQENPLWLITALSHELHEDKKVITVTTDIPCRLTMLWSAVGPIHEARTLGLRGTFSSRDPHISFHEWGWIGQEEPDRVLVHTFIFPREDYPNKIWYQFQTYYWPGYRCPACGLIPIVLTRKKLYWCYTCKAETTLDIWGRCVICRKKNFTTSIKWGGRCQTCGFTGEAKLFRPRKERVSCSPFFFQEWWWTPEMELLFHEPWTWDLFEPELLFHEPWSSLFPDLELLHFEPWDPPRINLELLFHEPWSEEL